MEKLAKLHFAINYNEKAVTADSVPDGSLKYTSAHYRKLEANVSYSLLVLLWNYINAPKS